MHAAAVDGLSFVQVVLLREQKELSEARAEKSGAEVKKLTAKVRTAGAVRVGF